MQILKGGESKTLKTNKKNKKKCKFKIIWGWNFCDQILQAVSILDKKLKIFIFIFSFNFNTFLFQNIFHFNISLGRGFPTVINLLNSLKYLKRY